jgi:hypothetical protein
MSWQCAYIASPEDEHCWHPQEGQRHSDFGVMLFFSGEYERAGNKLINKTNFDTYAFMVRKLSKLRKQS